MNIKTLLNDKSRSRWRSINMLTIWNKNNCIKTPKFVLFYVLVFYILLVDIDGAKDRWLFASGAYVLMRFSECLNPVFYNLGSRFVFHKMYFDLYSSIFLILFRRGYIYIYLIWSEFIHIFSSCYKSPQHNSSLLAKM